MPIKDEQNHCESFVALMLIHTIEKYVTEIMKYFKSFKLCSCSNVFHYVAVDIENLFTIMWYANTKMVSFLTEVNLVLHFEQLSYRNVVYGSTLFHQDKNKHKKYTLFSCNAFSYYRQAWASFGNIL